MEETDMETGGQLGEVVDDRGTSAAEGIEILKRLRDQGFDASNEKLAMTLGRPLEEIESWMAGAEPPDDDVVMKARGIATQRGLTIDS